MNSADKKLAIAFLKEEPAAAAHRLEQIPEPQVIAVLTAAPAAIAADVFKFMLPSIAASVIQDMADDYVTPLFVEMTVTDLSQILRLMPVSTRTQKLSLLPAKKRVRCETLIHYPSYTVGALVETDVLTFDAKMTVEEASIRAKKRAFPNAKTLYVLSKDRHLIGSLSIYDLIRAPNNALVADIMTHPPMVLSGYTEQSAALGMPVWENSDVSAVVNRKNAFVGVVYHHALRNAINLQASRKQKEHSIGVALINAYGAVLANLVDEVTFLSSD
ncbi:hypothetical protein OE749_18095 [Aestuariibacter sp. AA17]|uniref:Magnesium transporter MgtE intracellular domain-containing protein n=1 Tax=Fluctibacter corallii TaxID=2984329 RepID=A0ABT3AD97_9ALTE|nr:CBS domain-containing protein [Aestuariibacter sp. AA17]MCV2886610.1 hypothetical protein [Aestuariibacter sp. AA17]